MKKLMTLCLFAFAMILGTQTITAQSMIEVNSLASEKTQELKKVIKFDSDTEDLVYKTFQTYLQKKESLQKITDSGATVSTEDRSKIENMLSDKFKSIFTEDQFNRYMAFVENQR